MVKKKSRRTRRRRSRSRRSPRTIPVIGRPSKYTVEPHYDDDLGTTVYRLKKGSILYTGQVSVPEEHIFLTPHVQLAKMYADSKSGGAVFSLQVTRDLLLAEKTQARNLIRPSYPVGEWDGFGGPTADYSVGRSLCRKIKHPGHRTGRLHGWLHNLNDPTFGEVFLCNRDHLVLA